MMKKLLDNKEMKILAVVAVLTSVFILFKILTLDKSIEALEGKFEEITESNWKITNEYDDDEYHIIELTDIEHLTVFDFKFPLDDGDCEDCVGYGYNDALLTNHQMDKLMDTIEDHYKTEYE